MVRNFGKCGGDRDHRQVRFVRGPVERGRRVHWVLGKVSKCGLETIRQLGFGSSRCRSVEGSEEDSHYGMVRESGEEAGVLMQRI